MDLPDSQKTNSANLVKSISCMSSQTKQHITLRLENAPSNRITRQELLDTLLLLSFTDFRLREPATDDSKPQALASARDSSDYIARLLKSGIKINGIAYHFFGHSNSQLKSRSCFLYAASKVEISRKVEGLGDFSKLKSVGKKAKRIGLLFSSAEVTLALDPERCQDIGDVVYNDNTFTDGCGLISTQLANLLCQKRNIVYRNKRYRPSVFQIRYQGYKGVLTLCPHLNGKTQVQFRKSMKKFSGVNDTSFSIVEYSKPYQFGFLNDEIILLLHSLGVSSETLVRKQDEYLQFLHAVSQGQIKEVFQFLTFQPDMALAEKMLMEGISAVQKSLRGLVRQERAKMINKYEEQRCRIMIQKSRLLFGVCDPLTKDNGTGVLRPGTCFVRITSEQDGIARTIINTDVLVTRNPCLHPGDLQKFKAVNVPQLSHLVDCIVFPTQGKRPSADLMSGGDLDGDKFFVSWDPDIIPSSMAQAALYPGVKERIEFKAITDDDRADFFAKYTNASLGRVKNLYLKWARLKGPLSAECQQLNRLFSQCVDGNRIKVPPTLEDPPEPTADTPPYILDVLHDKATAATNVALDTDSTISDYSEDIVDLLVSRDSFAISEFQFVGLVLRKCEREGVDFSSYTQCFNYSALTDEQQAFILSKLPTSSKDMASLVKNGLLQSDLLRPEEVRRFSLHHGFLRWKPVFASSTDRMGRFLECTARSLELFHKKLIILHADERLTLMIYIPHKIAKASEVQVDAGVRVFALPRSSGYDSVNYRVTPTKIDYRLYCDESSFQLYQGKRGNTFVFLTRGPANDASYRDIASKGDKRRRKQKTVDDGENFDCRASVALDKISGPIQKHVGRMNRAGIRAAEVYVISNRDVQAMQFLDEWLQYIDTQEVRPLFEIEEREYRVTILKDLDRSALPESIARVIDHDDLSCIEELENLNDIRLLLQTLADAGQLTRINAVYTALLVVSCNENCKVEKGSLLLLLLEFLSRAVSMTEMVLNSRLWEECRGTMDADTHPLLTTLLPELILRANSYGPFVKHPFKTVLRKLQHIPTTLACELAELVALSVRDIEAAMDLLIEGLEPESCRLLALTENEVNQLTKSLIGIALDHIDEANSAGKNAKQSITLQPDGFSDGYQAVKGSIRIDSPDGLPKTGDHIRFTASNPPQNAPLALPYTMDAIVMSSERGATRFRCLHTLPSFVTECSWKYRSCGSFVTSKTMIDAVTAFYCRKARACGLYERISGLHLEQADEFISPEHTQELSYQCLNPSQSKALSAVMSNPLTLLWGPPGTGKTHTIVRILKRLLSTYPDSRVLVTAPTHNAVDNVLQKFVSDDASDTNKYKPLRVATQLSKVNSSVRRYTCDAMIGKDLSETHSGHREAQKRIRESKFVFTTCAGAGLGLLREEEFDIVIVDEASQQTEPETLIPLTKGCKRAVLVGDHVQLRATVQKHAVITNFDVSLFERLYTALDTPGIAKVMLDTQYRMHPSICEFSSTSFYEGRLQSAAANADIHLPPSRFPWPKTKRMVFIPCNTPEDIGHQSKSNTGQVKVCQAVCKLLSTPPTTEPTPSKHPTRPVEITILTPYTRQRDLLQVALPSRTVSSVDGYQGREADIIIFVSVRSNAHYDIGFLSDMRRLNVAMTRAKAGVIVIGDRACLVGRQGEDTDVEERKVWETLLGYCETVEVSME